VPPHVFGIDRERLFYGQFPRVNGSGPQVGEFRSVELEEDSFAEGPLGGLVREPADFQRSIETLVRTIAAPITEASLVLPDEWLRLAFTEVEELPRKPSEREEILRWKLKMQVPFRVEDLRLSSAEVPGLDESASDQRLLLSFGINQLLDQIEAAFDKAGIRVGHISNQSMSLLNALTGALESTRLAAVALVSQASYSLLVASRGAPVLHRFKSYQSELPKESVRRFVERDLRLTRNYLNERLGIDTVQRIVLICPDHDQTTWQDWLTEVFEVRPSLLAEEWPFLRTAAPGASPSQLAPLLGAAYREIA
jgi:hypothetical protein